MSESEVVQIPAEKIGAFFDVDETLVRGATAFWAAREMFMRRVFGLRDMQFAARQTLLFVLFGENQKKIDGFVNRASKVLEGKSIEEMNEISEKIFERYFVPHLYLATYERLKKHIDAGHQVWLISATPWVIAEVFARKLGLAGGIGTKMKVAEGRLVGGLDGRLIHGAAKVEVVHDIATRQNLNLEESWAYSDSANDIPLLSAVGHPVAVNPDRELDHYARTAGWEILRARKKSDIIRRRAIRLGLGSAAAGVTWAVGHQLWRLHRQ